jgi:hypothetical protein
VIASVVSTTITPKYNSLLSSIDAFLVWVDIIFAVCNRISVRVYLRQDLAPTSTVIIKRSIADIAWAASTTICI